MKLYTPAEIARFVACNRLGDANEREIIDALKRWDRKENPDAEERASREPDVPLPAIQAQAWDVR